MIGFTYQTIKISSNESRRLYYRNYNPFVYSGNIPSDKLDLAEIELPPNVIGRETTKIICPHCQPQFKDKSKMSKHIDRIHIGSGIIEDDMRQV